MDIKKLNEKLTKVINESIKEERTNLEVIDSSLLAKYDVSYDVHKNGKIYLHKIDDKVVIEYRLPTISGCSSDSFETVEEALKFVEKEISEFPNVSNIEFKNV